MKAKPPSLGKRYAEQFQDRAVAAVYRKRPPYPAGTFAVIADLFPPGNRCLLELGAGTGEIAIPMAEIADLVHAVEPSREMISVARTMPGGEAVRWFGGPAEAFTYPREYGLIVCAQSLHWMDWHVVLPAMAAALDPAGYLVIVGLDLLALPQWRQDLLDIIPRYSTNREFVPFDLISGLTERGLFEQRGSTRIAGEPFEQSIADFIDSIHARNGFSRDRMTPEAADAFDREVRELLACHHRDGVIRGAIGADVVWGVPRPGS